MSNSQTPASRAARARCATAANNRKLAEGWKRLNILISPQASDMLEKLIKMHGTKTAAIEAALNKENRMNSFIIADNRPVARLLSTAIAGACRFGFQRCAEALDANRDWNLVNARDGKISSAAKWQDWEQTNGVELPTAVVLNPCEFLIE